jgi:hypothetical protein
VRGKGINYDTGFYPDPQGSRPEFSPDIVVREMRVIAGELGCTAVRVSGGEPERLSVAAEAAAAEGLEVWFAPFPVDLPTGQAASLLADCADRAEHLRRTGASVVLVTGCELTLFGVGFLPGPTFPTRMIGLQAPGPELYEAFGALPAKLNGFLAEAAEAARTRFGGPITYASGMWEPVDWSPFDIVASDAYRDESNAATFGDEVAKLFSHSKPVAVTEFGCCPYVGAAAKGGMGWAIVDYVADPPRLDGDYTRDEGEQVRYFNELTAVFRAAGVDLAFWFTFAAYYPPRNTSDPRLDLDLASYGVVSMLPDDHSLPDDHRAGHDGLGWTKRLVFDTLAEASG